MRLTAKLTAILVLVITAVVLVQSVRNTDRLAALHLAEMRDDLHILASTLGTAADAMWLGADRAQVERYLEREDGRRHWVDIRITPQPSGMTLPSADEFAALTVERRSALIETTDRAMHVHLGIGTEAEPMMLELSYSLASHERYVEALTEQQLYFGFALVILSGAVLFAMSTLLVGRPIRSLMEQAKAVAGGDFSMRADIAQRDEIGELAREMNRMSQYLHDARAQVNSERRERTVALGRLRHADRLSTVGKIASSIAHELGTPLNVVAGRASMIAAHDDCPPEVADDARVISQQCTHMTGIIRQLLDFARRRGEDTEVTPLARAMQRAQTLLEPLAEERDIEITITGTRGLRARMPEHQALQVLTNLMVNAIQAMPDGGVVRLHAEPCHVEAPPDDRAEAGHYVRMSVIDHGVGIADEELDRVFEPFFTTKESGQGTGLGLSVCHGIVRERGGWIEVESTPGEGSRFSVYIPALPTDDDTTSHP